MNDIKNYYEVFTECWKYFKKYYEHYDGGQALADFCTFEEHFKAKKYGPRVYQFAMQIIRRCEQEIKNHGNDELTEESLGDFAADLLKIFWVEVGEIHKVRCKIENE